MENDKKVVLAFSGGLDYLFLRDNICRKKKGSTCIQHPQTQEDSTTVECKLIEERARYKLGAVKAMLH
jgi:argininosuccinate synthase